MQYVSISTILRFTFYGSIIILIIIIIIIIIIIMKCKIMFRCISI
jgi:hypothetical protein